MKVTMNKIDESSGDEHWDSIIQLCQSEGRDVIIDQDNMRVLVWDPKTKQHLDWDTEIEDVAAENNESLEDVLINDSLWNMYSGYFGHVYEVPSTWNYLLRSKDAGNDADGIITSPNCILFSLPDIKSGEYLKDDYVSPFAQMEEVSESKMGVEYIASTIEDCDANGLMAIADDESGIIYIYDPKSNLYATSKSLMEADASVDDIIKDEELKNEVMQPATGDGFKEFSVKWNDLEKKGEDEEVYKTQRCAPIHGNFAESIDDESHPVVDEVMALVFKYSDSYYAAIESDGDESEMFAIDDEIRALLQDGSNGNADFKSINEIMDLVYDYAKVCYDSIEGDGDTTEQNRLSDLIQSKVELVVSQV